MTLPPERWREIRDAAHVHASECFGWFELQRLSAHSARYERCITGHDHSDACGARIAICGKPETPMLVELLAEFDRQCLELEARPKMIAFDMDPTKMTRIVSEWPVETYGAIELLDTDGTEGVVFSGWAAPLMNPATLENLRSAFGDEDANGPFVQLRANGENSYLTPEHARRLAAMLIAAARGVSAFDPTKGT